MSRTDVQAALAGLGYGAEEIRAALAEIPESEPEHGADASQMLREALRRLAGPPLEDRPMAREEVLADTGLVADDAVGSEPESLMSPVPQPRGARR